MCFEGQNIVAKIRIARLPNTNKKHYNLAMGCKAEQFSI